MKAPILQGIGLALVVAALFIAFDGGSIVVVKTPPVAIPNITVATPAQPASTTALLPFSPKKQSEAVAPVAPAPAPKPDLSGAAARVAAATVNIICSPQSDSSALHTISGSGVIIDPRGIILTNAHVGQFLLLQHQASPYAFDCVIRNGNPAANAYFASPIYVSSAWIRDNSAVITESAPMGNGENDIALLGIDRSATRAPLPSEFPYVSLTSDTAAIGDSVVIDAYAAQFLNAKTIANDLIQTVVYTTIKSVFTFDTNTVDIISLGGSVAAQEGSSGGGIVNPKGDLAALITTSTVEGDLTKRDLRAITASYIMRNIRTDTGEDLASLATGSVPNLIEGYKKTADALALILIRQIRGN